MEKERRRAFYADLSLFAVAVIWGGGFVAGKAALTGFSAMTVVALRFCGAALLSGLLFFRIIRKSQPKVIRHGLMLGIIQFAAQGIQLMGLNYTTAGKQAFLHRRICSARPVSSVDHYEKTAGTLEFCRRAYRSDGDWLIESE